MKKILMAGESWMSYTTHVKGFDSFTERTGIFFSDCDPHWGPVEFSGWKYYESVLAESDGVAGEGREMIL